MGRQDLAPRLLLTKFLPRLLSPPSLIMGFPGGPAEENLPANSGDMGSISGSGRYPGVGNGNPLWYYCHGNLPWAEEPGRLQFMGLQRVVGQDQALVNAFMHHPSLINNSLNLPTGTWKVMEAK